MAINVSCLHLLKRAFDFQSEPPAATSIRSSTMSHTALIFL
jgi:hypothetical protein